MIGIDIVSIARIEKCVKRFEMRFLERFLSPSEIVLCKDKFSSIAGFFALKEACSKALQVGIGKELSFLDMHISKSPKNAPLITLSKEKMDYFNIQSLSASISHDAGFAIAVVMVSASNR
ncbi:holo-ACP synthase [Helicobacter pylori]|uniref:holo-ACP synthase n=1 Tax=Helicobacter pylori TaxID=210 RepID=UPI000575C7C8|nr:holo-ACP synthase [Helicobacter pylori]KHL77637.1 4'-phosphopantetheinyl transferase [Helicobacter pylori]KHL78831.1 4'-phosphopantetheinyl transferase [Helicobacter pylori]